MSFTYIPVQIEPNKSLLRKRLLSLLLWEISHLFSPSRSGLGRLTLICGSQGDPAGRAPPQMSMGQGSMLPTYSSWNFIHHTLMWDLPFSISTPPTSLGGCDFFNSIVIRFPFNSISDSSEWLLFYILVVILMWLCKEACRVSCLAVIFTGYPKMFFLNLTRWCGHWFERERETSIGCLLYVLWLWIKLTI